MYKNVVFPLDLTTSSWKKALPIVLSFVHTFGAELHLVRIIPDVCMSMLEEYLPKKWINNQKEKHILQLDQLIKQYIPSEIIVKKFVGRGHVSNEIINYATSVNADLVVIPSSWKPHLQDFMIETTASKIARQAKISVLIVRE